MYPGLQRNNQRAATENFFEIFLQNLVFECAYYNSTVDNGGYWASILVILSTKTQAQVVFAN